MFWKSLGVGSLINLASDTARRRDICLIQQESLISLRGALSQMLSSNSRYFGGDGDFENDSEGLELVYALDQFYYPEESSDALMQMQSDFYNRRNTMREDLRRRLADMKDEFYERRCMKMVIGESGYSELVFDEEGMPCLEDGCETPELKVLRTKWETSLHRQAVDAHDDLRERFSAELRKRLINLLKQHKSNLYSDRAYNAFRDLIKMARLEAAKLAEAQEEELWVLEIPDDEAIKDAAVEGLREIRRLNEEQREAEEVSEDMQVMIQFERELTAYIHKCHEELQYRKYADSDFLDLHSGLSARNSQMIDFSEIFPAHIVSCFDDLNIGPDDF